MGSVAQALVVPVRLPGGAFVGHAAFAHDIAGMGIVGVMAGLNAVKAHFFKEKTQNGIQGFGHDAAVPPVFPDAVADFGGADFIIHLAGGDVPNGFSQGFEDDHPVVVLRGGAFLDPAA